MIQPHGGQLIDRVLKGAALDEALKKAASLPSIPLDAEQTSDVENIATGVFSPWKAFWGKRIFGASWTKCGWPTAWRGRFP